MMSELTARQREIYDLIVQFILHEQRPPTVRELMRHTDIRSPNGIVCHLKALEKKGVIERCGNARGIRLVADLRKVKGLIAAVSYTDTFRTPWVSQLYKQLFDAPAPVVIWLEQILSERQ